MSKEFRSSEAFQALREKAETMVRNDEVQLSEEDELDLVRFSHQLEVQRVELELQNEELRLANRQLEESRTRRSSPGCKRSPHQSTLPGKRETDSGGFCQVRCAHADL